jgi:hypothetical protein
MDLHKAWVSESDDFTPWLAQPDNLRLLGETLGMQLELMEQEKAVGRFGKSSGDTIEDFGCPYT